MEKVSAIARTVTVDGSTSAPPIIVHSHLRWDFVWQRPQQILSRLADRHAVLFVEEPIVAGDVRHPKLELSLPAPGVIRAVPHLSEAPASPAAAADAVRALLRAALAKGGALAGRFERPIQWFYTPLPAPAMLGEFGEGGVVYDCMDELSKFRFAPPELVRHERLLLHEADVVFTGGSKLYDSKARLHHNVHFFGCGVDVAHFGRARRPETVVPADVAMLPRPIVGFFGVIDERIDYELLGAMADGHPDWAIVMVGPVVKVDPAHLPRAHNLHWLGQREYTELPGYLKAFDVCLMPFALNEATEFINPTKTLEYMTAGRPIVSTAVPDVVRHFASIVRVAKGRDEFVREVADAIARPDAARLEAGMARAATQSWPAIVAEMRALMMAALAARAARKSAADRAEGARRQAESRAITLASATAPGVGGSRRADFAAAEE